MSEDDGFGDVEVLSQEDELELLRVLRSALRSVPDLKDPAMETAPASVLEGARWVHDWHNMDADLARLAFDSHESLELAGVRSASSLRQLTFVSDDHEIAIDIEPGPSGVSLTGTVTPVVDGNVEILVGGIAHRGTIDDLGAFVLDNVDHGTALAFVTTVDQTIRLGSFEL